MSTVMRMGNEGVRKAAAAAGGGGAVKYMECLKNHAAAIGGSATDGCREFMAGGDHGTLEALMCSACECHRNFHRKVLLDNFMMPMQQQQQPPDEANVAGGGEKRARSKFSQEQKEKMVKYAEKIDWKIPKADDEELQSFCEEIGVNRKILKIWMHNNKYHHHHEALINS